MKNVKITKSNIIICILLIFCILLLLFIFINYKANSTNSISIGKNIIFSKICLNDTEDIITSQYRIFKFDSTGKCISCKIILNRNDSNILNEIATEIVSYDISSKYSNVQLQEHSLYFNTNEYNGLTEEEIKISEYNKFQEVSLKNTQYKVYTSTSEF